MIKYYCVESILHDYLPRLFISFLQTIFVLQNFETLVGECQYFIKVRLPCCIQQWFFFTLIIEILVRKFY